MDFFLFFQLELKYHSFFSPINWDDLMAKKITPPFIPSVVRPNLHHDLPSFVFVPVEVTVVTLYSQHGKI